MNSLCLLTAVICLLNGCLNSLFIARAQDVTFNGQKGNMIKRSGLVKDVYEMPFGVSLSSNDCSLCLNSAAINAQKTVTATYQADYTNQGGLTIMDGNPVGITIHAAANRVPIDLAVAEVTVTLNISGGHNGDLLAILIAPNGTMRTLMDQPGVTCNYGFGQSGKSMSITFSDAEPKSIQDQIDGGNLSGSYRAADILGSFGLTSSTSANGTWTLLLADQASGGGTSHLNSWSLKLKLKM